MPKQISCAGFEELAVLYAAGELSDEDRAMVDAHANTCAECMVILRGEIALQESVAAQMRSGESGAGELDDTEFVLAQCRSELAEALDDEGAAGAGASGPSGWRSWFVPARWPARLTGTFRHALALHPGWSTVALLIVGALGGTFGGTIGRAWYRATSLPLPGQPVMTVSAAARLSDQELETMGVEGIHWEPQDGTAPAHVEVRMRSGQPVVVQGPADASEIRRVLTYVLAHGQRFDPAVRLDSLDILRTHVSDPQVRAAFSEAALRDEDPAVRLKALEALRGRSADSTVQQVMLGALADGNSGVRIEAVNALLAVLDGEDTSAVHGGPAARAGLPALSDPQALEILRDRERNDPNNYVRLRSAAVLGRLASLQTGSTGLTGPSEIDPSKESSEGPRP